MKRVIQVVFWSALAAVGFFMLQNPQTASRVTRAVAQQLEEKTRDAIAPEPTAPQLSKYETLLCNLANADRKKRGLPQLKITPALGEIGRGHSREMMQKKYFSHTSPTANRRTPMDRYVLKYERRPRLVAENIYKLQGPPFYRLSETDFRRAHAGWMKSPGHRENILRTEPGGGPTQIGVGIIVKDGSFWATQMFARP